MSTAVKPKHIWLYLLHTGGWHCTRELAGALAEQTAEQRRQIGNTMRHLVDGHCVKKRVRTLSTGEVMEFGVTTACMVPSGITLEELQS
jgi:hypothetical protein